MAIDSLRSLEVFVTIADAGGFTAAADRLGLTVNVVSRQLLKLEAEVGARLVDRTTRRSSLTDAGRRLHARATALLEAAALAEVEVQQSQATVEGLVRVALPSVLISSTFLGELAATLRRHPRLSVDLRMGSTELPGEGVDIAVVAGTPPESQGLVGRRMGTHGWSLAASPEYAERYGVPRTPRQLSRHACLRYRGVLPQRTWTLTDARGRRAVIPVGGAFECDDSRVLGDATYAGLGIGVRPDGELAEAVARGALVHVLPRWRFGATPVHLLTTAARRRAPKIVVVAKVVEEAIRSLR